MNVKLNNTRLLQSNHRIFFLHISFHFISFIYFNTGRPIQHKLFFDESVHKIFTKYDEGKNTIAHTYELKRKKYIYTYT